MFIVIRQRGVDLREGKMWILKVHFLGARAVGHLVEHDLNDLSVRTADPGDTLFVDLD